MALDEEELTPLEEDSPPEVDELEALDDVEEEEVELELEVEAVEVSPVEDVPGTVAALTAPKRPTPATAAKAAA